MFKILNRFAWFISIILTSFIVPIITMVLFGANYNDFVDEAPALFFVVIFLITPLVKRIFISEKFIKLRLKDSSNFSQKIEEDLVEEDHEENKIVSKLIDKIANHEAEGPESVSDIPLADSVEIPLAKIYSSSIEEEGKPENEPEPVKDTGPSFIQKFFAENALAKIGGIFLFLAVLFLLQAVYNHIGPIEKLMIGFAIAFIIFGVGLFVDHKGYHKESKILFGSAILINYLVILAGRYLISEEMVTGAILGETITFFLLIMNTIFAVSVSMAYKSYVLLFFSFVVAYFNPFLIGDKSLTTPYTFVIYSIVVSLGVISLSYFYSQRVRIYSVNLLNTAFLGGNILILLAPFETDIAWLVKLFSLAFLSFILIGTAYKNKQTELMGSYFVGTYLFLALMLAYGTNVLGGVFAGFNTVAYLSFMIFAVIFGFIIFSLTSITSLVYLMFSPLIILITLMYNNVLYIGDLSFIVLGSVLFYFMLLIKLLPKLSNSLTYGVFGFVGLFLFSSSNFISSMFFRASYGNIVTDQILNFQFYGIVVSVFIFLLFAYYFSSKKGLEYLYSIGTIFSIFMILPIVSRSGDLKTASIISIILLMFFNILVPFFNFNLLRSKIRNLLLALISAIIFVSGEIFYFWYGDINQSKITLGVLFMLMAILYFIIAFAMNFVISKYIKHKNIDDSGEHKSSNANIIYSLIGISISLFSLAIAYIFSEHSEVVSIIWILESSVLLYFYKRTKDLKIYIFNIILMIVGIIKMTTILDVLSSGEYLSFIPIFIMFLTFVIGLKFLEFEKRNIRLAYDIFHIIGIIIMIFMVSAITPIHYHGWFLLDLAIISVFLALVYGEILAINIRMFFILFMSASFIYHVVNLGNFFRILEYHNLKYFKFIHYISTILFILSFLIFKYLQKQLSNLGSKFKNILIINLSFSLYLFVVSSQYVYFFFNKNIFSLTIYWGLLSFVFLNFGIQREIIKLRTLGLYILSLTAIKILFYDIWSGLDNVIMRVVALILVGAVMIAVSILYSKKYEGRLSGEFDFDNLIK